MVTSASARKRISESAIRRITSFRRDEEGSLLIFGLFCFVIMLMLSGVALDLMRFEERRTTLQNTIDRASLAAADLQQTLDPKEVVKDYFRKAGLTPPADNQITVVSSAYGDSRRVSVSTSETLPTWFMRLAGVNSLSTPGTSTAEESVGKIEISLILDVSGSMAGSRINNLIPAAKSFVDQIFDSAESDKVSISIVPYSTQVSLSPNLISYFNVTAEQTVSNCIEFEPSKADFTTTAVSFGKGPADRKYQRNGHFDPFYKASPPRLMNCDPAADRRILPFSSNRSALKTFIDGLRAEGNTSIDLGMKWGAALLDPSMQPVVTGMIGKGNLPSSVGGRPYSYSDGQVLKIIVLMTDGENTTEYKLRNASNGGPYNEGFSPVYRNLYYAANNYTANQYSIYDPSTKKYFSVEADTWLDHPWGDKTTYSTTTCNRYGCSPTTLPEKHVGNDGGDAVQMTWPEVWARMSIFYLSDNIISPAFGSTTRNQWRPSSSNPKANTYVDSAKDAQTLSLCTAAKNHNVRIYTIAFEAPTGGRQLLSQCASSDASHYEVEGLDIQDAFSGIVQSINKLRLTH